MFYKDERKVSSCGCRPDSGWLLKCPAGRSGLAGHNLTCREESCSEGVAMMPSAGALLGVEMVCAAWWPETVLPESWTKRILNILWPRPPRMYIFITETCTEEPGCCQAHLQVGLA